VLHINRDSLSYVKLLKEKVFSANEIKTSCGCVLSASIFESLPFASSACTVLEHSWNMQLLSKHLVCYRMLSKRRIKLRHARCDSCVNVVHCILHNIEMHCRSDCPNVSRYCLRYCLERSFAIINHLQKVSASFDRVDRIDFKIIFSANKAKFHFKIVN
jgi:hypothetical protein